MSTSASGKVIDVVVEKFMFRDPFHKKQLARWFEKAVANMLASPLIDTTTPGNVHVADLRFWRVELNGLV